MDGSERGVGTGVKRRQVWRGFLDWFRPVDHEISASRQIMSSIGAQTNSAGSSMRTGRAMNRQAFTAERAGRSSSDDVGCEIDEGELLEFLAADYDPPSADPAFRERLRNELWELVQEGASMRRKDH
jgi:hypothetical protein